MEYTTGEWSEDINLAIGDIEQAKKNAMEGQYEWAYLKAKLAAEGAIKALIIYRGGVPKGRSIMYLLRELVGLQEVEPQIYEFARFLEAELPLATEKISQAAIIQAEKIVFWAKDQIK